MISSRSTASKHATARCFEGEPTPGGRLSLRTAARELLATIDGQSVAEIRAAGWTVDELAALERVAAWPENPAAERVERRERSGAP